jgi:hypothetical protein
MDDDCRALAKDLSELFGVRPGFSFYLDESGPKVNSLALPYALLPGPETEDTVLIGVNLIEPYIGSLKVRSESDSFPYEILIVMAHEFGHILQFKVNAEDSWQMEPHADFLAGWAAKRLMSKIGLLSKIDSPKSATELQKELGPSHRRGF